MANIAKRIELIANVAIVVVALLLGTVLVKRYLLPQAQSLPAQPQIQAGSKLSVPDVDWGKSKQTLLLVLSTSCRYCTESAPFYQRLIREKAKHGDVRVVAVLPQSINESQQYLSEHGVAVDEIKQASLDAVQVRGTPTLIMADQAGSVVASWMGKLPPQTEDEVLRRFFGPGSSD